MKKKLSLVMSLALTLFLAACGNQTGSDGSTPPAASPPDTPPVSSAADPEPSGNTETPATIPGAAGDSGIRLSRYVFIFLPGLGSAATARRLHMLASYWGLLLMSFHLGLNWGMVLFALLARAVLSPIRKHRKKGAAEQ